MISNRSHGLAPTSSTSPPHCARGMGGLVHNMPLATPNGASHLPLKQTRRKAPNIIPSGSWNARKLQQAEGPTVLETQWRRKSYTFLELCRCGKAPENFGPQIETNVRKVGFRIWTANIPDLGNQILDLVKSLTFKCPNQAIERMLKAHSGHMNVPSTQQPQLERHCHTPAH